MIRMFWTRRRKLQHCSLQKHEYPHRIVDKKAFSAKRTYALHWTFWRRVSNTASNSSRTTIRSIFSPWKSKPNLQCQKRSAPHPSLWKACFIFCVLRPLAESLASSLWVVWRISDEGEDDTKTLRGTYVSMMMKCDRPPCLDGLAKVTI